MKKTYIIPATRIHSIRIAHRIAAASDFGVNNQKGTDDELGKSRSDIWGSPDSENNIW